MHKLYRVGCSIIVFLMLTSCTMFQANLAIDAAVVWADAQTLSDNYQKAEVAFRLNKDKFSAEDWALFEEFDTTADYVVNKYNDMAVAQIVDISLDELNLIWAETKSAYILVRERAIANEDKFKRIEWFSLRAFDFKATQVDTNLQKLMESGSGDATAVLTSIAAILGMTLKIATIAAAI